MPPEDRTDGEFGLATSTAADWPPERLVAARRATGQTISFVLVTRDSAQIVGGAVGAIRRRLIIELGLADEVLVVDRRSTDRTLEVATAAGATAIYQGNMLASVRRRPGPGAAAWEGIAATSGGLVVVTDPVLGHAPDRLAAMLGPLLHSPEVMFVKGFHEQSVPLVGGIGEESGADLLAELVARPLLCARWPRLAEVIEPVGLPWAVRRDWFEQLSLVSGGGVELELLLAVNHTHGPSGIAQVGLGARERVPRPSLLDLEVNAAELLRIGLTDDQTETEEPDPRLIQQVRYADGERGTRRVDLEGPGCPPLAEVAEYVERRRGHPSPWFRNR